MSISERWWYAPPWKVTRPWLPRVKLFPEGGDEYCNPTVLIVLPLLGDIVVRYKRGPARTQACATCQAEQGPWCEGCRSCHTGPRCHPRLWACEHPLALFDSGDVAWETCPRCKGDHCTGCEPECWDTRPMVSLASMPVELGRDGERRPVKLQMAEGELIYCSKCKSFYRPGGKCTCP